MVGNFNSFGLFCVLLLTAVCLVIGAEENDDTTEDQTFDEGIMTDLTTRSNITNDLFWTPSPLNESFTSQTTQANVEEDEADNEATTILSNSEKPPAYQDQTEDGQNITNFESTTKEALEEEVTQQTSNSETDIEVVEPHYSEMNEKIVLPRGNCNLELPVDDNHDTKLQIKFKPVTHGGSGRCSISLNGQKNALLAVQITNVHLQNGKGNEETLKVVLTTSGIDFVLKQYYEEQKSNSLLLTESHAAYIILQYNITNVETPNDYSHFDLEAFRYGTNQQSVFHQVKTYQSPPINFFKPSVYADASNIYFTTDKQPTYHESYYSSLN